jgi:hypothetical protein
VEKTVAAPVARQKANSKGQIPIAKRLMRNAKLQVPKPKDASKPKAQIPKKSQ